MTSVRQSFGLSAASKYIQFATVMVSNVVIARLLTPSEIGIYAVAAVLAGIAQIFRDFGISQYLVREPQLDDEKLRTAFTLMLIIAWSLALGLVLAAGGIAAFYGEPALIYVLRVQALSFVLVPFGSVNLSLLTREMRFGAILWVNVASSVVQPMVAISLAYLGFGALSLAWASVAGIVTTVFGVGLAHRGRIWHRPGLGSARAVLRFGSYVSGTSILGTLNRDIPELIIGKALGMSSLAFFNKALLPGTIFSDFVLGALRPVLLPAFSKKVQEGAYTSDFLYGVSCITGLVAPALLLAASLSDWVIILLFGSQWLAAADAMPWLALATATWSMSALVPPLLTALGEVRGPFRVALVVSPTRIVVVLLLLPHGLKAIAMGWFATSLLGLAMHYSQLQRLAGIPSRSALRASLPAFIIAIPSTLVPTGLIAWWGPELTTFNAMKVLLAAGAVFSVFWCAGLWYLRHPLYQEVIRALRHVLKVR